MAPLPRGGRLAVAVFVVVLLGATAAAFAVAERLKLERAPVTAPRFDRLIGPTCECERARADLEFRLRRADVVEASIVDADGNVVRTLSVAERRAGAVRLRWNGRTDRGQVVPDGRYRLRLDLERADRTIVVPNAIRVDTTPPRVELASAAPHVISPDGDGRGDRVLYRYTGSEEARAVVYVDGRETVRSWLRPAGRGRVPWRGRVVGGLHPEGTFSTWLTLVDAAGNESEPTRRVPVRVRYVELARAPSRVAPGGLVRVRIDADAKQVRLRAVTAAGRTLVSRVSAPGVVAFRAPNRPGRLTVVATVGNRSDRASVRVG